MSAVFKPAASTQANESSRWASPARSLTTQRSSPTQNAGKSAGRCFLVAIETTTAAIAVSQLSTVRIHDFRFITHWKRQYSRRTITLIGRGDYSQPSSQSIKLRKTLPALPYLSTLSAKGRYFVFRSLTCI